MGPMLSGTLPTLSLLVPLLLLALAVRWALVGPLTLVPFSPSGVVLRLPTLLGT